MPRKKYCDMCGELIAVLDGNPEIYGELAVSWHKFIRMKWCGECRKIKNQQSRRLADKRYRKRCKKCAEVMPDALDALLEEVRLSRQRIAELEAKKL